METGDDLDGMDFWAKLIRAKEHAAIASNCLDMIVEEPDAWGLINAVRGHGERLQALAEILLREARSRPRSAGPADPPETHERCAVLDKMLAQAWELGASDRFPTEACRSLQPPPVGEPG